MAHTKKSHANVNEPLETTLSFCQATPNLTRQDEKEISEVISGHTRFGLIPRRDLQNENQYNSIFNSNLRFLCP